jgi:hypothetical protein
MATKRKKRSSPTSVAALFEEEPEQWGLRGDPFLWAAMRSHFETMECPATPKELVHLIERAYATLTGHSLHEREMFFVPEFSHGGMSSGHVSPEFWTETALPLLLSRQQDRNPKAFPA